MRADRLEPERSSQRLKELIAHRAYSSSESRSRSIAIASASLPAKYRNRSVPSVAAV